MVHDRARADAEKGDRVDLVVRGNLSAAELAAHVAKNAAVVGSVDVLATTPELVLEALSESFSFRRVVVASAENDQTTPVATAALTNRLIAGEDDRVGRRADRFETAAALDDKETVRRCIAHDRRTGRNRQRGAILDDDRRHETVGVVGTECHVFGDITAELDHFEARKIVLGRIAFEDGVRIGRGRTAGEEKVEDEDAVSDVDAAVVVRICGVSTLRLGTSGEQKVQNEDAVSDVEVRVVVGVTTKKVWPERVQPSRSIRPRAARPIQHEND